MNTFSMHTLCLDSYPYVHHLLPIRDCSSASSPVAALSGGSRRSARRGQFNMFPSISHLFLHWRGPKSIAKLDGEHGRICPPWIYHWSLCPVDIGSEHPCHLSAANGNPLSGSMCVRGPTICT